MNSTIIEQTAARTVLAPNRLPGRPARRILVVEDNAAHRELNARVLELVGYQVDCAEDGAEGWRLLNTGNFDLLITDDELPRLSGFELVQQVRSAGMTLPIILVIGWQPEGLARLPLLQLDATLLKPLSSNQLRQTVKRVLSSGREAANAIQPPACA